MVATLKEWVQKQLKRPKVQLALVLSVLLVLGVVDFLVGIAENFIIGNL
jgi:hypothetical protein